MRTHVPPHAPRRLNLVWFMRRREMAVPPPGMIPPALIGPAEAEFRDRLGEFAEDLWREVQRLEAAHNSTGGPPQITSPMVASAYARLTDPYSPKRRSPVDLLLYAIGALAMALVGVASNERTETWAFFALPVGLVVGVTCGFVLYIRGQS